MGDDECARSVVFSSASTPRRSFVDSTLPFPDARCSNLDTPDNCLSAVPRAPTKRGASSSAPSVLQLLAADTAESSAIAAVPSTSSSSVRSAHKPGQEPVLCVDSCLPNKRLKVSSQTYPETLTGVGERAENIGGNSNANGDVLSLTALREDSQQRLEALNISQQNTQECTQLTVDDSPPSSRLVLRLALHPEVDKVVTAFQKNALEQKGLYRIEMQIGTPCIKLGREEFLSIFDKKTSAIDPVKLSRTHCLLQTALDPETQCHAVFISDHSTNGIKIDNVQVKKDVKYKLQDGQEITLLSRQGNVLLGYVVEDPHVKGAQERSTTGVSGDDVQAGKSQERPHFQEYTLGVLFSAPLVGKDVQGKYHPIAELDVKREYSILQKSLIEASKFAKRTATDIYVNTSGSTDTGMTLSRTYECSRQINVVAKFANTDTFRAMITLGCRALHFSGHGDENHLYFEDGMGLVHPIPHKGLQELFLAGGAGDESTLRLVFVSACSSAPLADAFVSCGIPHVIGVRSNQKIEDYAAIEFTRAFYLALATGKSVGASFTIAQQSVAKSPNIRGPLAVADKFVLYPEDGDHSEVIFPLVAVEATSSVHLEPIKSKRYPTLWFDDMPAKCQGFCCRSIEVYKISLALMMTQSRITRLVTICGEEGVGKTAVAHAVANYVGPRITSEGGVCVFSVARLAQDEMDELVGMVRRNINIANGRCRVLNRLETMVTDHIKQHKARLEFSSQQMLMVIDGCDYLLRSDARRDRFRAFLSEILTNNGLLKIVLTARTSICTDGAVRGHGERLYTLSKFDMRSATMMLVSLMSRPIRVEELNHARLPSTTDKLELIASHPVLRATKGIPKRIADLAGRLNETTMDKIPVDETLRV
uniref:FHA domain-containing protein n=1 Tax=Hyaloperonospora arabidopsidis (strain Emoy2) TaxID=559515 RepID=M4BK15_HYAAE